MIPLSVPNLNGRELQYIKKCIDSNWVSSSGVLQVIAFAFKKLKLHRLEANIQPENKASIALAKACGFKKEGFSPKFIKKGGQWKDHERWALLSA